MLEVVTIGCLFAMFVSTLIGVLDRVVLNIGLPWTEELARFLLIWGSLLSGVVATKRNENFRLTLVLDHLGKVGGSIVDLIIIGALGVVIWYGVELTRIANIQTSPALGIPMSWVYVSVPVCAGLMLYCVAEQLLRRLQRSTVER